MSNQATQQADLLLHPKAIIPIVPKGQIFFECSVAIKDGRIVALAPRAQIERDWHSAQSQELADQVLMPGLVNCHGHAAMSLLRGFADDLPLMQWLQNHIWPAEARHVNPEFVALGTELACAEMLLSGTSCFSDMYFFPEVTAATANKLGMRAQVHFPIIDFANPWAQDTDEALRKGLALFDDYAAHPRVSVGFGPHAPYTLSDNSLQRVAVLANELQAPVQIHLHETAFEVEDALEKTGQRPIQRLEALGLLGPQTQCVHMTQLTPLDIGILQSTGAKVVHCPKSNLKLASGFCPVEDLITAGVTLGLGTDGAASNNTLDLFSEMHVAALLSKAVSQNASSLDAHRALQLATLDGATVLGLEQQIGSLEVGKRADILALQLHPLLANPHYNLASLIVYSPNSYSVQNLWVEGKALVKDGALQQWDMASLRQKTHLWQERIATTRLETTAP
jgi:5-methylthioadenosine/S-adenosylhomocysteine deaminase